LNYSESLLFHGGDTGSTPVRDANHRQPKVHFAFACQATNNHAAVFAGTILPLRVFLRSSWFWIR